MDKKTIRNEVLQKRRAQPQDERDDNSNLIFQTLINFLSINNLKNVMSYQSTYDEVNTSDINNYLEMNGIKVSYPVILKDNKMAAYLPKDYDFNINQFHINEPNIKKATLVKPNDLDIIIVPLVAFDNNLNRLGRGKGYYDRYLKKTHALTIGLAYELQKVSDTLPSTNDVPLDYIITESNIYQRNIEHFNIVS